MFSVRLKQLREKKCITQEKLAEMLGRTKGSVGNWESGTRQPDYLTLEQLSAIFNVSVDYILGISDVERTVQTADKQNLSTQDSLKYYVEAKLGRQATKQELELINAATDGIINSLKNQTK